MRADTPLAMPKVYDAVEPALGSPRGCRSAVSARPMAMRSLRELCASRTAMMLYLAPVYGALLA